MKSSLVVSRILLAPDPIFFLTSVVKNVRELTCNWYILVIALPFSLYLSLA